MTRLRRGLTGILVLAILVVVLAAGFVVVVGKRRGQPLALPAPTGPFAVGRVAFDWVDRHRVDDLAPRRGRHRELAVWVWYPASPQAGGVRAAYAPGAWGSLHLPGLLGLFESDFRAVRDRALEAVPVASGRFPIVVLEPGLGFAAPQYAVLAEELASHGYVVAGVTPTYSANNTVLHGKSVPSNRLGNPPDLGSHTGAAATAADHLVGVWAADARFVAARVTALGRAGMFAGRVPPGAVAYVGHSFGGAAALEACHGDPACGAAVDLDGTQFGTVVRTGLDTPLLILGSENSCVTGSCRATGADDRADRDIARRLLRATSGPVWCYAVSGARHFDFTDYAVLYLAPPVRSLFALGKIDGTRAVQVERAYTLAFLNHALRGSTSLPAGPDKYQEVQRLPSSG